MSLIKGPGYDLFGRNTGIYYILYKTWKFFVGIRFFVPTIPMLNILHAKYLNWQISWQRERNTEFIILLP